MRKNLFIFCAIMIILSFPYSSVKAGETNTKIEIPGNIEEFKQMSDKFFSAFPEALKKAWQEALSIWQKLFDLFKEYCWDNFLKEKVNGIIFFLQTQFGDRILILRQEIEKEAIEIKEDFLRYFTKYFKKT